MIEQLKGRSRRWIHCLFELMPWRLIRGKKGHCALTLSEGFRTIAVGCTCGRTFWAKSKQAEIDMHDPVWRGKGQ